MVSASGVSKTIIVSSDRSELCDRLKLSLQEKQAAISCDLINHEIVSIVEKTLKYKGISEMQHNQLLNKCKV